MAWQENAKNALKQLHEIIAVNASIITASMTVRDIK